MLALLLLPTRNLLVGPGTGGVMKKKEAVVGTVDISRRCGSFGIYFKKYKTRMELTNKGTKSSFSSTCANPVTSGEHSTEFNYPPPLCTQANPTESI